MKKRYVWGFGVVVLMVAIACQEQLNTPGATGPQGPQGPAGTSPSVAALSDISKLVAEENDYRAQIGQDLLTSGLTCTLYTVPNTTTTIASAVLTTVGSYGYDGVFNQPNAPVTDGLNILPIGLRDA